MRLPARSDIPTAVLNVCRKLAEGGGHGYLVGGCVRDLLLGLSPKDFDIEAYGLNMKQMQRLLADLGKSQQVGKSFGVIKLWLDGREIDIALPRREQKVEPGHRGFSIAFDPKLEPEEASSRRDFTINAMMLDPLSMQLLDFHGGQDDLEHGVLRHISAAFAEDALRVLRAMQFASRFKLRLADETARLSRQLLPEAATLAVERIWQEWAKWAAGQHPSMGLAVLEQSGWVGLYPELQALVGCPQEPRWHPEGDVWTHTCYVVDVAASIATRNNWRGERRFHLLFAALVHDLGKPVTTHRSGNGHIRSPEHCLEGIKPAQDFLTRIGAPKSMADVIAPLVKEHLTHLHGEATGRAVRRLSHRLEPADIELWEALIEADASGRPPQPPSRPALAWLDKARALQSDQGKPEHLVTGKLLLQLGMEPGPEMGALIAAAYEAQLDGDIHDGASALAWCRQRLGRS